MPNARRRDDKQELQIDKALAGRRDVIVDNTNASRDIRAPIIAIGKRHAARLIAYYFECTVKTALMRNRGREGKSRVPDVAVFVTAKKLQPPAADEGFDEIHVIKCDEA